MKLSYLDKIRKSKGKEEYKSVFMEVGEKSKEKAVNLINDKNITFPSLFMLLTEIEVLNLSSELNTNNSNAVKTINYILSRDENVNLEDNEFYNTLLWIVNTGYLEDGLGNEYDEILDISVSILINTFNEKSILPIVSDMIFKRNQKGFLIHDLVWAYFRIHDPYALKLIAEYIKSPNREDIKLACKLLNIQPPININDIKELQKKYNSYISWLSDNDPFLYFTGESFQFSSEPKLCSVNYDRKYICKGTPYYVLEHYIGADENEYKCLQAFNSLNEDDKIKLSEYSYKLYKKNISKWQKWILSPIGEQMNMGVGL